MPDPDLEAMWIRAEAHLRSASAAMPVMASATSAYLAELLDHDELGLALDVLVSSATAAEANDECWADLNRAVDEMRLTDRDPTHGSSVQVVGAHRSRAQ
jgi:hypothetical protein